MGDYEKLTVWAKAHALTCSVYRESVRLPQIHQFVLGDQMRRASLSIGTNIVEGTGRDSDGHFANHLTYSLGSANELHYLLLVARDVGALVAPAADHLRGRATEVRRMLAGLLMSVQQARYHKT